jgi:hypothetical protein
MTYIRIEDKTVDYIQTICIVWLVVLGSFMLMTFEVTLLISIAFPVLIILLLKNRPSKSFHSRKVDLLLTDIDP